MTKTRFLSGQKKSVLVNFYGANTTFLHFFRIKYKKVNIIKMTLNLSSNCLLTRLLLNLRIYCITYM